MNNRHYEPLYYSRGCQRHLTPKKEVILMNKSKNLIYYLLSVIILFFMTTACGLMDIDENDVNGIASANGVGVYSTADLDENSAHSTQDDESFGFISAITFEETDATWTARGFPYVAHVNDNQYYFENANEERNLSFIVTNERLISGISDIFDLGRSPVLFFLTENTDEFYVSTLRLVYNHNNYNTRGWLVHAWSNGSIPVWLAAGIESVALSNIGEFEASSDLYIPEHFGDFLFSPANWDSPTQVQAVSTAYHFVRYLMEAGVFEDAISLFRSRDGAANELIGTYFYRFSGSKQVKNIQYTILGLLGASYSIIISSDLATYHFIFDDFNQHLDINTILLYAAFSDDGIEFIYNWYSQFFDFDFVPIGIVELFYGLNPWAGGTALSSNHMRGYNIGGGMIYVVVHEAVHVIELQIIEQLGGSVIRSFSEGLAEALALRHAIYDRDNFDIHLAEREDAFTAPDFVEFFQETLYDIFESQVTVNYFMETIIADLDIIRLSHFQAYVLHYHPQSLSNPYSPWVRPFLSPEVSVYIASYYTARSFVLYLLEAYGDKKYAQVHFDLDNFENVYGVTLHEMVERWRGFLRAFADDIRTGRW